ncbi:hypothetical protein RHJ51_003666 [Salmonella enterica]|nr:hypothetical protein [Salmonella enterica]
MNRIQLRHT